jgi:hypothetical protein
MKTSLSKGGRVNNCEYGGNDYKIPSDKGRGHVAWGENIQPK